MKSWNPVISNGQNYWDPENDTGNQGHEYLDIVGEDSVPAAYMLFREVSGTETEDQLLFRIRIDGKKNAMPGAFQVLFESTGDTSVDWYLELASGDLDSEGTVSFGAASGFNRSGVTFDTTEWTGSYTDYIQWTGTATDDGSQYTGDDDYFIDIAMPLSVFADCTGISSTNDPFRVVVSSSQNNGSLMDGDIALSSAAAGEEVVFSDVYSDTVPEPRTLGLCAGIGAAIFFVRHKLLQ